MTRELKIVPALLVIINNMLGSGINYMPAAFKNSGFLFSWVFLFGISILTALSIMAIFISAKNYGHNSSYSKLGAIYSIRLKIIIEICIMFTSIFVSIAFQRYITNLILALIPIDIKKNFDAYYLEIFITMLMSIILCLIVQIKKIADLKIFSYISVMCVISLIGLLLFCNIYLSDYIKPKIILEEETYNYTFSISFFIFTLCCQDNMVELYSSLKNKNLSGLLIVSICAPFCGLLINGAAGFLGYRLLGDYIGEQDIIKIFADNSSHINKYLETESPYLWYALKIQSVFAILVLVCGFPLQVAPSISLLKKICSQKHHFGKYLHHVVATFILIFITGFNCIPKIDPGKVLEILSFTSDNFIAFFFPFLFLLTNMRIKSKLIRIGVFLMLIPSCLIFFNGVRNFTIKLSNTYNTTDNYTDIIN